MLLETMLAIGLTAFLATFFIMLIGPENAAALGTLLKFIGMGIGLIAAAVAVCAMLWCLAWPLRAHRRRRETARLAQAEAEAERLRDAKALDASVAMAPEQLRDLTEDPVLKAALDELVLETARWRAHSGSLPSDDLRAGRHALWVMGNSCLQMLDRPLLRKSSDAGAQLAASARATAERLRAGPKRVETEVVADFSRGLRILDKQIGARS